MNGQRIGQNIMPLARNAIVDFRPYRHKTICSVVRGLVRTMEIYEIGTKSGHGILSSEFS